MREHKLRILTYAKKNLWLLIIPIIRAVLAKTADADFFRVWISGIGSDVLVLFAVIFLGWIKWLYVFVEFNRDDISAKVKLPVGSNKIIPYKKISSVTAERGLLLRLFRGVRVSVDTSGGAAKKSDMELLLRRKDWEKIIGKLPKSTAPNDKKSDKKCNKNTPDKNKKRPFQTSKKNPFNFNYKPSVWIIFIFSLLFSSSISGATYVAALLIELGRTAGDLVMSQREAFTKISEDVARALALKIPPVGMGVALLLILSKLFSFVLNLLRYARFEISRHDGIIRIHSGVIGKRDFFIVPQKINYTDLGQNLMMKIFGVTSIHVNCAGYGKKRNEIPVFLPIMRAEHAYTTLQFLNLNGKIKHHKNRPRKTSFFTYTWFPLVVTFLILAGAYVLIDLVPFYKGTIVFFLMLLCVPAVWALAVKIVSLFTTGYSKADGYVYISVCRGLDFHNITIKEENIVKTVVSQSFFQRIFKQQTCDITFYLRSDRTKKYTVKSLLMNSVNVQ